MQVKQICHFNGIDIYYKKIDYKTYKHKTGFEVTLHIYQ